MQTPAEEHAHITAELTEAIRLTQIQEVLLITEITGIRITVAMDLAQPQVGATPSAQSDLAAGFTAKKF